jgi:phosphatidyl-myo-inositol alpha-mannosyltransferase
VKIALVCPYDWARHGGVRAHVANLAAWLGVDHEVRVLAPMSEGASTVADGAGGVRGVGRPVPVPYNRSVAPVALSPLAGRRVVAALRGFDPHVVHVHEPLAPVVSVAAAAFGPRPVVGTFHAWSEASRVYRLAAPVGRRVAGRLDARIAVSTAAQQFAAGSLGLPLGAFRVIPNGVDVDAFAAAEPLPDLVDPDRPLLLFVGRLEPRKGLDVLVRAFLRLRTRRPRVRLCVVGDGPERDRCQQMVPPSIRPDALFVGRVAQEDLARYHASADLLVSPATGGESFGIVLLEGMAAGLPVVASDIPGYRTVMKDGRQGRLVPAGDAFALADAIDTLLANDRLRRAMATEGRQTAAEHAWPVIGGRLLDVYRSVL